MGILLLAEIINFDFIEFNFLTFSGLGNAPEKLRNIFGLDKNSEIISELEKCLKNF